jgi:hypothetical protein
MKCKDVRLMFCSQAYIPLICWQHYLTHIDMYDTLLRSIEVVQCYNKSWCPALTYPTG